MEAQGKVDPDEIAAAAEAIDLEDSEPEPASPAGSPAPGREGAAPESGSEQLPLGSIPPADVP
jgi:hypothetical protein